MVKLIHVFVASMAALIIDCSRIESTNVTIGYGLILFLTATAKINREKGKISGKSLRIKGHDCGITTIADDDDFVLAEYMTRPHSIVSFLSKSVHGRL